MVFSANLSPIIISKATKNQGFTLSLEDKFSEKTQGRQIDPPICLRVKIYEVIKSSGGQLKLNDFEKTNTRKFHIFV